MDEAERDALYAKVFASPDGSALLADHRERGHFVIRLNEIAERLMRARARWATGPHHAERTDEP